MLDTRLNLFENRFEVVVFCAALVAIFLVNLGIEFYKFKDFTSNRSVQIDAVLENSYLKNEKYYVNRLKFKNLTIYTTTKNRPNVSVGQGVRLKIFTQKITFIDFFKGSFYASSSGLRQINLEKSLKSKLLNSLNDAHESGLMREFYSALYLATPISKELRSYVTNWGIAHIIAISGFHIGIIFGFVFLVFAPIYRFFQDRFFPYRSLHKDINLAIFLVLFFYLWLIDFTPSFLRSLIMSVIVYLFLLRNLRIISFATLALTIGVCVAFKPNLMMSLGFYFSCMGVLFIYLYIKHFGSIKFKKFGLFWHWIFINLWTFFGMNIVVYYFFPTFSFQQISVILLGGIFVIFYPLSLILHLIGQGGLFDFYLESFLKFHLPTTQIFIPFWLFLSANFLAIGGIRFKLLAVFGVILGASIVFLI